MKPFYLAFLILTINLAQAQQEADTSFQHYPKRVEYAAGKGPIVTVDAAHNNFHTIDGRYKPFASVLQRDGYVVESSKNKFTVDFLRSVKMLVIANALADSDSAVLPTPSAFTQTEIKNLNEWVANGGSLFLMADHMPFSGAASELASSFGFNFINGYAVRTDERDETFSKREKNLLDCSITRGRNKEEKVDEVMLFTGQGFLAPKEATVITRLDANYQILLPPAAGEFSKTTPSIKGKGFCNGAFLVYGKGRIVVFGEAALFSAQVAGNEKVGFNKKGAEQNQQLLLNIIHWLDASK